MNTNVKPVIMTRRNSEAHSFRMCISQDIPETVNAKGNLVPAFKNFMDFKTETSENVTNENLAAWAMENIVTWAAKGRLNAKKTLKLSKDVVVEFTINNKSVTDTMKFSLSPDRIEAKTKKFASLISLIFRKHTDIHKANENTTMNFIRDISSLLLVAKIEHKAKKEAKKLNAPSVPAAEVTPLDKIEDNFTVAE